MSGDPPEDAALLFTANGKILVPQTYLELHTDEPMPAQGVIQLLHNTKTGEMVVLSSNTLEMEQDEATGLQVLYDGDGNSEWAMDSMETTVVVNDDGEETIVCAG